MPNTSTRRSQSAMEYLMTYGWVILVIAVILAVLFQLGVFNGTNFTSTACIAQVGFICVSPSLTTSGSLLVSLGQVGSNIAVTGLACVNGSAAPSSFSNPSPNPLVLVSSQEYLQTFACPLPSGATIGTHFSGHLWIQYNQGAQTALETSIAYVTAVATSAGSSGSGGSGSAYIPITLTNSGSTATPSGFQEKIDIGSTNCVGCAAYEHGNLNNIEFTTAANGAGTVLDSWIETTPSNSASSVTAWVNLGSTTIAGSGGTTTIYMDMLSTNTMTGTSGVTGEAPQLSPSYSEYDNGANVFNLYSNFAGGSLPSGWSSTGSPTIDNGVTVTFTSGTTQWLYTTATYSPSSSSILDVYGYINAGGTSVGNAGLGFIDVPNDANPIGFLASGSSTWEDMVYPTVGTLSSAMSTTQHVYSMQYSAAGNGIFSYDYGAQQSLSGGALSGSVPISAVFIWRAGAVGTVFTQWLRLRDYPPSGTMPSATFGALVIG